MEANSLESNQLHYNDLNGEIERDREIYENDREIEAERQRESDRNV